MSVSARRTHLRNVSDEQPNFSAIEQIAAHSQRCSPRCSDTIRTARSRTSGEYIIGLPILHYLPTNRVSGKPGAVHTDHWDTMLRVAATIRHGHLPASLLVSRLQAAARQNQLTRAIQEYGRIIKTISLLRYLHDEQHRRRIHRQLNKGETLHALRRQLVFANQGELRRRRTEDQDLQGECITLLTNAIITWNTVYTEAAIQYLTQTGTEIPDQHLAHLSPAIHKHINFYGRYDFTNPTPPPPGQLRPLRTP